VKINEEQLLKEIAKQNFVIFLIFIGISLVWRSLPVTLGVIVGGAISIGAYMWLGQSLARFVKHPTRRTAHKFQAFFYLRLIVIGLLLYLAIAQWEVHPVALSFGLSVVVLSIFIGTLRYIKSGEI
jgi:hypothetical protein